jgi:hypothetical protein
VRFLSSKIPLYRNRGAAEGCGGRVVGVWGVGFKVLDFEDRVAGHTLEEV